MNMDQLKENGRKAFRMTERGEVFIGDEEFPYPVSDDEIVVRRIGRGRHHLVTLTLIVGDAELASRKPRFICDRCNTAHYGSSTITTCSICDPEPPADKES